MTIWYRKSELWGRKGCYISTETMDEQFYFGNTVDDCVNAFKKSTGIRITNILEIQ